MHPTRTSLLVLVCLLARASHAAAQVLPPSATDAPKGDLSPHVDCNLCGERCYTFPSNAPADQEGNLSVWCTHCKRDTPHRSDTKQSPGLPASSPKKDGKPGNLTLRRPDPRPAGATPESRTGAHETGTGAASTQALASGAASLAGPNSAPAFVFAEVRKLKSIEDRLVDPAVESLSSMGNAGLLAARGELGAAEAPVVLVAARVLLRSAQPTDLELIEKRLRSKLPASVAAPLLAAFVRADPVRGGPRFLLELLDSPYGSLRSQAARELRPQLTPALLESMRPALASKRAETRVEALSLIGSLAGPRASAMLLDHLADPASHVATEVVSELAGRREEGLDARLLALAFGERWILRANAYALLALVEREDLSSRAILDDARTETLLASLSSSDPFVSGASACALAGIGFRSVNQRNAAWLDQDVIDRLVTTVSGKVFHNDFAALQAPSLRRLKLLTGQEAANESVRWVEWWVMARNGFHARRAWIQYEPAELVHLRVRVSTNEGRWLFLGSEEPALDELGTSCTAYFLTPLQARDLALALQHEGVFGPEHLPGVRGSRAAGERVIEVSVAGRGKSFVFGPDVQEPWFERIVAAGRALAERERWQQFQSPGRHASTHALWLEQSAWWSADHSAHERSLALKGLVLAALSGKRGRTRELAFAELERLYADPALHEATDFRVFLNELAAGASPERLPSLIRMAIAAARSIDPKREFVPQESARELVRTVLERADPIPGSLATVLEAAGPAFAHEMLADPRPAVRASAARVLARFPEVQPAPALIQLLTDKSSEVEAASIESLGDLRVVSARTELLVRARLGLKPVRSAALRAIGKLGGEYVLDALLLALSDVDKDLREAAVQGMGELEDPASAPFLVSLLSDPPGSPIHDAARAGLLRLGKHAWPELKRALLAPLVSAGRLESALVLSEQCVPEAVPALLGSLTVQPRDARVASELSVLTCVDFRAQPDPAGQWWNWWDGVLHDDSLSWFRAALERAALAPPPSEAFAGRGSNEARTFLLRVLACEEAWLAERARRELARLLERDLDPLPPRGASRANWIDTLRTFVEKQRDP